MGGAGQERRKPCVFLIYVSIHMYSKSGVSLTVNRAFGKGS